MISLEQHLNNLTHVYLGVSHYESPETIANAQYEAYARCKGNEILLAELDAKLEEMSGLYGLLYGGNRVAQPPIPVADSLFSGLNTATRFATRVIDYVQNKKLFRNFIFSPGTI